MWILFGLLCALLHSLSDLFYRKIGEEIPTEVVGFSRMAYTGGLLWIPTLIEGIPEPGPNLLRAYAIGLPLELIATLLYLRALSLSPLSIVAPLFAFSPAFLLVTGPLFMHEQSSLVGALGVLLITAGAYVLNISKAKEGFLAPIKSLTSEKGAVLMLGAALLFSITANMGRLGVLNSSAAFFGASYFSILALVLLVPVVFKGQLHYLLKPALIVPGIAIALSVLFHLHGVGLIQASYFIAVKRLSLLFSILLGIFVLREKGGRDRIIGGTIMLIGVVVILLFR